MSFSGTILLQQWVENCKWNTHTVDYETNMVKSVTPEFSSVSGKGKREKKKDTTQYNVCSVYKYHFFHRHNLYNLSQLVTRDRQRGGNRKIQQKFSLLEQIKDRRWQTKITRLQYCHGLICTKTGLLCSVCV